MFLKCPIPKSENLYILKMSYQKSTGGVYRVKTSPPYVQNIQIPQNVLIISDDIDGNFQ